MGRAVVFSLCGLVLVYLLAQSFGLTPAAIEDRILLAELNHEEGTAWREQNGRRNGVATFPNGLQVEVLTLGDGPVPGPEDWVQVHYRGQHIDGREFDNTRRRGGPATVPVERTIPAWRQVLLASPVGTRLRLVAPPELAYGAGGGERIGPQETLVFELDVLAIVPPEQPAERPEYEKPVPNLR